MTRCLLSPARRFFSLALAVGLVLAPAFSHAAAPAVELILLGVPKPADDDEKPAKPAGDENVLPPTAAFELRFAAQMVAADQVGKEAADSPLVFAPELPGSFRWTSQRGGVYTLTEPPPLGMSYQAALKRWLNTADGQPIGVPSDIINRTFRTPGLEIGALIVNSTENSDLPVRPKMHLVFNSAVSAAKVAPAFSFRAADGNRIAARVTAAPENASSSSWNNVATHTWREQFLDAHTPADAKAAVGVPPDSRNRLEVDPGVAADRWQQLETRCRSRSGG